MISRTEHGAVRFDSFSMPDYRDIDPTFTPYVVVSIRMGSRGGAPFASWRWQDLWLFVKVNYTLLVDTHSLC